MTDIASIVNESPWLSFFAFMFSCWAIANLGRIGSTTTKHYHRCSDCRKDCDE